MTREKQAPMGRREARRADRREAIIAAAYQHFFDHGYAATRMSAIAARIGGSKATLWNYFPSKEALFEAVLDTATAAYHAELTSLFDAGADPVATLRSFCTGFIRKVTAPPALALHRLVHAEAGRFPEMGEIFYDRAPRATQGLLAAFIGSAMERGLLRTDDPLRAARVLTSLCMSGSHQQLLLGRLTAMTPELVTADAQAALDIFLRAYAPEKTG